MQIHEITTKEKIDEGVKDFFRYATSPKAMQNMAAGYYGSQAARSSKELAAKGYGAEYQGASDQWQDKLKTIGTSPASKQFVNNLAKTWIGQSRGLITAPAPAKPAATPAPAATTPVDVSTVKAAPKGGAPTPQEQEKFQQKLAAAAAQQLKEAIQDPAQYRQQFSKFVDDQLATRESQTRETITLAQARRFDPTLDQQLNLLMDQVVNNAGTAQEAAAVQNYITHALAGIQALAQNVRNKEAQTATGVSKKQLAADEWAELSGLAKQLGGVDKLIAAAKKGAGTP